MGIVKNTKKRFGEYFLKKESEGLYRNKEAMNFSKAKNIGILFDATVEEDFDLVKKYIKFLKDSKKRVRSFGYYNTKEIPAMQYAKLEVDFFTKKQVNWHLKPSDPLITNFTEEEFDILINFTVHQCLPLVYIAALSKAKFKIGKHFPKYEMYYDLLLEVEEGKSLKYFMRNVDVYLNMINA
ncbi:MAG TPA: hypothetical protein PKX59_04190 [Bacteroidia bacterium]|nr:hypothetical protein [Bacteroidia bacterium]